MDSFFSNVASDNGITAVALPFNILVTEDRLSGDMAFVVRLAWDVEVDSISSRWLCISTLRIDSGGDRPISAQIESSLV